MELLKTLEEKISALMSLVSSLKSENVQLCKENSALQVTIKRLQLVEKNSLQDKEKFSDEKALTKSVVDDLIKNIDALVDKGIQP